MTLEERREHNRRIMQETLAMIETSSKLKWQTEESLKRIRVFKDGNIPNHSASRYENEAKIIKEILGENCIAIHHIGSTSIVGLDAKPIIDIMPVVESLKKNFDTKAQKELNYNERLKNIQNIFSVINKKEIKDKNILLVDDIITTCATVNACAKELSKYAYSISACAVARNKLHKKTENK